MTDDLDIRLKDLLAERGRPDPLASATLVDSIAGFPARSSRRFHPVLAAGVVVMVVGVGAFLATRGGFVGGVPVPPDPAAFAGDPRMDACFAAAGSVQFAFEMRHARDYLRHLPAMGRAPELEVEDPAFAVIFKPGHPPIGSGGAAGASSEATQPGHRAVCVRVGDVPNLYTDVDITGFQPAVPDVDLTSPSTEPSPAEATAAGPTVAPAPFWVADLRRQLECVGPPDSLGQEVENPGPMEPSATPDDALQIMFLNYRNLPTTGWEPTEVDGHWARHRYVVGGRLKVVAVSTDSFAGVPEGTGWEVVGVRSCDPSEFEPPDDLITGQTVWLDVDGNRVRTDVIKSFAGPGHCGWESAVFLYLDGIQYFRDPNGVLAPQSIGRFDPDASLPSNATDTGYHITQWQLFTVPGGDAVFVRTRSGVVERWPRAREPVGCM